MNRALLWKAALAFGLWLSPSWALDSQTALVVPDSGPRWEVSAGSGLGLLDGQVGWGLNVSVARGGVLPTGFWMGLDIAVYRWDFGSVADPLKPFSFSPLTADATLVQVLPTFIWDLPVAGWSGVTPYLGLSVGPAVYLAAGDSREGNRAHESLVGLAAYIRPGLRAALAPSLQLTLEAKLGMFRSRTIFLPQFALALAL